MHKCGLCYSEVFDIRMCYKVIVDCNKVEIGINIKLINCVPRMENLLRSTEKITFGIRWATRIYAAH